MELSTYRRQVSFQKPTLAKSRLKRIISSQDLFFWMVRNSVFFTMVTSMLVSPTWWRMLVTTCSNDNFGPFSSPTFSIFENKNRTQTFEKSHQYRASVTNTQKLKPRYKYQHLCGPYKCFFKYFLRRNRYLTFLWMITKDSNLNDCWKNNEKWKRSSSWIGIARWLKK